MSCYNMDLYFRLDDTAGGLYMGCLVFSTLFWLGIILFLKYTLKLLLMYHGWMYEGRGKVSIQTKAWLVGGAI